MLELSELLGDRTIVVPFGQHSIEVTYRLGERTSEKLDGDMSVFGAPVVDSIVRMVAAWDLVDGGEPVPLTVEAVAKVPVPVLRRILVAIVEDNGLGEAPSSSVAT